MTWFQEDFAGDVRWLVLWRPLDSADADTENLEKYRLRRWFLQTANLEDYRSRRWFLQTANLEEYRSRRSFLQYCASDCHGWSC